MVDASDICKVVRVRSDNPAHEGGFIEINESDFVEGEHTLFDEAQPSLDFKPLTAKAAKAAAAAQAALDAAAAEAEVIPPEEVTAEVPAPAPGWGGTDNAPAAPAAPVDE